jgi:hypothetical protein
MPTADITIWRNVEVSTIKETAVVFGWNEFLFDRDEESPTYGQRVIPNPETFGDFLRRILRNHIKEKLLAKIKTDHASTQDHNAVLNALLSGATD